jgi:hypothetical protein
MTNQVINQEIATGVRAIYNTSAERLIVGRYSGEYLNNSSSAIDLSSDEIPALIEFLQRCQKLLLLK